jgi:transketolase
MSLSKEDFIRLHQKGKDLRKLIVDTTFWAGSAHIGGAMSMLDMMVMLYHKYLNIDPADPEKTDRDRFVLSKGHAGVGHAAVLADLGFFDREWLKEFNLTGSNLGIHLDRNKVPGVDISTGSLGHGLSISLGLALGARRQEAGWKTWCILGDGEMNEGSVWEAAMAINHYRATNLITIVDRNRCMIDGETESIMGLDPLEDKLAAFGFDVLSIDGHDLNAIDAAFTHAVHAKERPVCIVANTVKGKSIDFMEDDYTWHYGGIDSDKVELCKSSIENYYRNILN